MHMRNVRKEGLGAPKPPSPQSTPDRRSNASWWTTSPKLREALPYRTSADTVPRAVAMQRRHSFTAYSPSELLHAHPLRLPPPVDPNQPPSTVAAVQLPVLPEGSFVQQQLEPCDVMASRVYDHVFKSQQRSADNIHWHYYPYAYQVFFGACSKGQ